MWYELYDMNDSKKKKKGKTEREKATAIVAGGVYSMCFGEGCAITLHGAGGGF